MPDQRDSSDLPPPPINVEKPADLDDPEFRARAAPVSKRTDRRRPAR